MSLGELAFRRASRLVSGPCSVGSVHGHARDGLFVSRSLFLRCTAIDGLVSATHLGALEAGSRYLPPAVEGCVDVSWVGTSATPHWNH